MYLSEIIPQIKLFGIRKIFRKVAFGKIKLKFFTSEKYILITLLCCRLSNK